MDLSSWTVEICYPVPVVPVEQPVAAGGSSAGGAAGGEGGAAGGEGGAAGEAAPVCPPPAFPQPFDSLPVQKGNQCCYNHTQICG
jgi:hypothetical protein